MCEEQVNWRVQLEVSEPLFTLLLFSFVSCEEDKNAEKRRIKRKPSRWAVQLDSKLNLPYTRIWPLQPLSSELSGVNNVPVLEDSISSLG